SLAIRAAEAAVHPNFPDADTILIVELDGPAAEVSALFDVVVQICRRHGATTIDVAGTDEHRARIWRGRKAAFAAMGRVSPNYYVQDGVVPRTRLPEVLNRIRQLERRSGLRIGNVFHAVDVAAALRHASDERQSIVIRGAGTKSDWGRPAGHIDVFLDMKRLNRVLAHQHGDLTAIIEAGATLHDVNHALARHGQWLPLD